MVYVSVYMCEERKANEPLPLNAGQTEKMARQLEELNWATDVSRKNNVMPTSISVNR